MEVAEKEADGKWVHKATQKKENGNIYNTRPEIWLNINDEVIRDCTDTHTKMLKTKYEAAVGPIEDEDFFEFTARYKSLAQ